MMAKSKIIKQFVCDEINIKSALMRILILAQDIRDNNLGQWIQNEIQGYKQNSNVPTYRKVSIFYKGNYKVVHNHSPMPFGDSHNDDVLPTAPLNKMEQKEREMFLWQAIKTPIDELEQSIKNSSECVELEQISPENYHIFGYKENYINLKISNARKVCKKEYIAQIIEQIRFKIINILTKLEQEFGCLDELDIDIDSKDENQKQQIYNIINIIIQDNHIDNSITMGNENEISNSSIANKA